MKQKNHEIKQGQVVDDIRRRLLICLHLYINSRYILYLPYMFGLSNIVGISSLIEAEFMIVLFFQFISVALLYVFSLWIYSSLMLALVDWLVVLFYVVLTFFGSFNTKLSHFAKSFKQFCSV